MSDLIDRQAAIERINKQREHLHPNIYPQDEIGDAAYRICAEFIERLPSEEPEVVRCQDCAWWDRIDDGPYGYCHSCKHGFYSANWEISIYRRYKEDFFCADGERRTDE